MRSSRRRQLSSRRSSTAHSGTREIHRGPQGPVRGRADLPCAVRARDHDRPSTYYDAKSRPASKRTRRDEDLKIEIARVHAENYGVYGPRKVWLQLNREGIDVARCTIERLMNVLGLQGIRRGKKWKTTIADPAANRPLDLVKRRFS